MGIGGENFPGCSTYLLDYGTFLVYLLYLKNSIFIKYLGRFLRFFFCEHLIK